GNKAFAGRIPGVAGNRRRGAKRRGAKHRAKSQKLAREMGISANVDNTDTASERGSFRMQPTMGNRWVRLVRKMPGVVMAFVVLSLGALSAPVLDMELSLPADTTSNPDTTQRKAADLLSDGFYPGVNGPFLVIVD